MHSPDSFRFRQAIEAVRLKKAERAATVALNVLRLALGGDCLKEQVGAV